MSNMAISSLPNRRSSSDRTTHVRSSSSTGAISTALSILPLVSIPPEKKMSSKKVFVDMSLLDVECDPLQDLTHTSGSDISPCDHDCSGCFESLPKLETDPSLAKMIAEIQITDVYNTVSPVARLNRKRSPSFIDLSTLDADDAGSGAGLTVKIDSPVASKKIKIEESAGEESAGKPESSKESASKPEQKKDKPAAKSLRKTQSVPDAVAANASKAPYKKEKISAALRQQVWKDAFGEPSLTVERCPTCYRKFSIFGFHVAHIKGEVNGGTTTRDNLIPSCAHCNLSTPRSGTQTELKELIYPSREDRAKERAKKVQILALLLQNKSGKQIAKMVEEFSDSQLDMFSEKLNPCDD
jgi:hypothetical protein